MSTPTSPPTYDAASASARRASSGGAESQLLPTTTEENSAAINGGHLPESSSPAPDGDDDGGAPSAAPLPALMNLLPRHGEATFQRGYLGYSPSFLEGSLQIKVTSDKPSSYRASIRRITIELVGVERVNGSDLESERIELVREVQTLWERDNDAMAGTAAGTGLTDDVTASGSNGSGSSSSNSGPPSSLDWRLRLTDDLPHCCHIGSGSIEYSLKASLHTGKKLLSVNTPVHITRASPPLDAVPPASEQASSSSSSRLRTLGDPEVFSSRHPTDIAVYFPHGTASFRRSESIELRVRIPPPDATLVQDKGLKLRSVSAQLHRQVCLRGADAGDDEITPMLELPALDTLISHSGKAAAFSSSRSVFLNIWLQPVPADFCEAITQSTIFLDVRFKIVVIASFQGRQGDREEVTVLDKIITILPDFPPASAADLGENASAVSAVTNDAHSAQEAQRGSYRRQEKASTSAKSAADKALLAAFERETEFDGYEQLSEEADPDNAPPSIDADQPPPALDPSGVYLAGGLLRR